MAKRDMPKQPIHISDQEWSSVQGEVTRLADKVQDLLSSDAPDKESVIGTVINCKKLNLRAKPSKAATIIYEMPADSKLTINPDRSVNGWLYICTESGLEGFCMKDFVSIN